jgi:NAD(P)-dependent dehydrogenase (short-subunit alcohol dehydrogenase family)
MSPNARTIVVTGSAGGIGRATRTRLEADGHRVIGVDVRDAEVIADLATVSGRAAMIADVAGATGGTIDGLVAAAGIGSVPGEVIVSINYFGAIATLDGLRPMLARGDSAAAIALSSNSTTTQAGYPLDLVEACLGGDEAHAREFGARDAGGISVYPATKLALARWVRRHATTPEWIGAGITLNAIAPGLISTPMTAGSEDFILGLGDLFPIPIRRAGEATEVAGLLAYLLGPEARFFCGSMIYMDGGTDATLRSDDWPAPQ